MKRTLLKFESLQQIAGSDEMAVITLTDESRLRALSIVCDADMTRQLMIRMNGNKDVVKTMLPEALVQLLPAKYEMLVVGIYDGQYQVVLMNVDSGDSVRLRMSDAVLLTIISQIPIYIEEGLMKRQCVAFDENASGVAIPINSLDITRLQVALNHALEVENYELASQIRDEIKKRKS